MNIKKIYVALIALFALINITGCSNPFQKEAIIVNNTTKDTDIKENQNDTNIKIDNNENIIIEDIDEIDAQNEEEIVNYFEETEDNVTHTLNNSDNSETSKNKVTNFFVDAIDFIFYEKEINGVKFNDLTDSAKSKILNVVDRVDTSIENKFPNYKENIKDNSTKVYTEVSDKIKEGINYLEEKTEDKIGTENYDNLKDNYEEVKDKTKNGFDKIKDVIVSTKDKIKNWYEEKTGK